MWTDIFSKFHTIYWETYIQQLVVLPLEVCSRFLPVSGLAIYYFVKRKYKNFKFGWNPSILTLSGIVLFNFTSYWLAPSHQHTIFITIVSIYCFIIGDCPMEFAQE